MRNFVKVTFKILLLVFALCLLQLSILASPQRLFNHHITVGNYGVYSDSIITPELLLNVIDANARISVSELYSSNFRANIFFCSNPDLYSSFLFLIGKNRNSSGVNLSVFGNTFINLSRIKMMREFHDIRINYSHITGNTSQILAHELTHNLVGNYLGFLGAVKFPRWKSEGYSEYISTISAVRKDNSTCFSDRCNLYYKYNLFEINPLSKFYYQSQLITEYLFEYYSYSFDKFSEPGTKFYNSERLLLGWLKENSCN